MALTGKIMDFFADKAMTIPAFPRTKVKAISDDDNVGLNVLLDNKQEKHSRAPVLLSASNWSNMMQVVNVNGVTVNGTIVITPAPTSHTTYGESGVYCSAQADGTLTFACSETPVVDLTVNVLILN